MALARDAPVLNRVLTGKPPREWERQALRYRDRVALVGRSQLGQSLSRAISIPQRQRALAKSGCQVDEMVWR